MGLSSQSINCNPQNQNTAGTFNIVLKIYLLLKYVFYLSTFAELLFLYYFALTNLEITKTYN